MNHSASRSDFRRDINGLRAIAVTVVALFHFGIPGMSGGFVGVDVFFVISGFLMTAIIVNGLTTADSSRFNVLKFYAARARRIIPALVIMCVCLLVFGWFYLLPSEYQELGTHVAASNTFVSNIKFWMEAGYFDKRSHEKWLLHTWSLSVEWQFYLLYPWLLIAVWRWRASRQNLMFSLGAVLAASLIACVLLTPAHPTAAFYSLPTRAWEMLAGGVIQLLASRRNTLMAINAKWLESVGLILVVGSVIGIDSSQSWPGALALIPVMGTCLVIFSARQNSIWTGNILTQWLGDRSYSIYLWHWPMVLVLEYFESQNSVAWTVGAIAMSIVLGHLSFVLIEIPMRRARSIEGHRYIRWIGWTTIAGLIGAGLMVRQLAGVPSRLDEEVITMAKGTNDHRPNRETCHITQGTTSPECHIGGNGQIAAVVLGDSHGDAVASAISAALPRPDDAVLQLTYSSCHLLADAKPVPSERRPNHDCAGFTAWAKKRIQELPQSIPVYIVTRSTIYTHGRIEDNHEPVAPPIIYFESNAFKTDPQNILSRYSQLYTKSICEIAESHPTFILNPIPEMGFNVPVIAARRIIRRDNTMIKVDLIDYYRRHEYTRQMQQNAAEACNAQVLDPVPYLCKSGQCNSTLNGKSLYFDDDHLSEYGNKLLTPLFRATFSKDQLIHVQSSMPSGILNQTRD